MIDPTDSPADAAADRLLYAATKVIAQEADMAFKTQENTIICRVKTFTVAAPSRDFTLTARPRTLLQTA